jgi:hypothetical protein
MASQAQKTPFSGCKNGVTGGFLGFLALFQDQIQP